MSYGLYNIQAMCYYRSMLNNFSLLIKPISYGCNLRCRYCFYCYDSKGTIGTAKPMDDDTIYALIKSYASSCPPPYSFAFQGGEPLLCGVDFFENFVQIMNKILPPRTPVGFAFQTNGTLIDERWVEFFKRTNALIGISIDGNKELHDKNRIDTVGEGTYDKAKRGYDMCIDAGVPANILATVNSTTVGYPKEVYKAIYEGLECMYMQFIPIYDLEEGGTSTPFSITGKEYSDFMEKIFECYKESSPPPSIRLFDNLYEVGAGKVPSSCQMHERCGSYFLVESDGSIFPCDFYAENRWRLGNVKTDRFSDIYKTSKATRFRELKQNYMKKHCGDCSVSHICLGGCPHYSREGSFIYCHTMKTFIEKHGDFFNLKPKN